MTKQRTQLEVLESIEGMLAEVLERRAIQSEPTGPVDTTFPPANPVPPLMRPPEPAITKDWLIGKLKERSEAGDTEYIQRVASVLQSKFRIKKVAELPDDQVVNFAIEIGLNPV